MANRITSIRILLSTILLFSPALSPAFYLLYLTAGLTDILDGVIARKTDTAGEFGAKLDTFADFVFVSVCLIKLLPILDIPLWLYLWIAAIAVIKLTNIALGYIKQKQLIAVHSVISKIAGAMLFTFVLTLPFIDIKISGAAVCAVATAAAIYEIYLAFLKAHDL